jgi:hypothetical protein
LCLVYLSPLKPSLFLKPLKAGSLEGALEPRGGKGRGEKGKKWGIPCKFKLVFILTREKVKKG